MTQNLPKMGADVVFVEADTKKEALVKGVRELRRIGSGWLDDAYVNPFKGLKADKAECEHGFCYCELKDCPNYENDLCPECEEEYKQNCVHEMYTGPARLSGQKQVMFQEYCSLCMQTRREIDARSNQRFNTDSNNII